MDLTRKKLPIGIQNLAEIISEGQYYVDKTPLVWQLIQQNKYFFLSRPRRFGKSLLIDTIKELFEANQALFKGLYVHDKWDWTVRFPVLHISFSDGGLARRADLERRMAIILHENARRLAVPWPDWDQDSPPGLQLDPQFDPVAGLRKLIRSVREQHGQRVVVLVDEYDKPILDNIDNSAVALAMRDCLRGFYSVIKGADADIRFAFLTGVSKFSKVSLFSGLNNLRDITVSPEYSAICGYTAQDVATVFAPELPGLDLDEIKHWYNGYNWLGEPVYNPYDLLLLFQERKFAPYWFESGTPGFLIKMLTERQAWLPSLGQMEASASLLATFDVEHISTTALMFQAGYLTLDGERRVNGKYYYKLCFPNEEVRQSLFGSLLEVWTADASAQSGHTITLFELLETNDLARLQGLFQSFFASIPYNWHVNNAIANYEGYYASVFYAYFAAAGLDVRVEDATSLGRVDMAVLLAGRVVLFEFKVVEQGAQGKALQQIKDKHYADKYRAAGGQIYMVGVEFSKATRNVVGFEVEMLGG